MAKQRPTSYVIRKGEPAFDTIREMDQTKADTERELDELMQRAKAAKDRFENRMNTLLERLQEQVGAPDDRDYWVDGDYVDQHGVAFLVEKKRGDDSGLAQLLSSLGHSVN